MTQSSANPLARGTAQFASAEGGCRRPEVQGSRLKNVKLKDGRPGLPLLSLQQYRSFLTHARSNKVEILIIIQGKASTRLLKLRRLHRFEGSPHLPPLARWACGASGCRRPSPCRCRRSANTARGQRPRLVSHDDDDDDDG